MMDLREILQSIRDQRNELNDEIVVQEASDPDHPLHHRFEWDDTVAGHKYRLVQAQEMLRVTFKPSPEAHEIRAFWPIRGEGARTDYVPTEEVVQDPVSRQIMLRQMNREWESFKRRYEHMEEFATLISAEVRV